jgi:hypothetical protein
MSARDRNALRTLGISLVVALVAGCVAAWVFNTRPFVSSLVVVATYAILVVSSGSWRRF